MTPQPRIRTLAREESRDARRTRVLEAELAFSAIRLGLARKRSA